MSATCQRPHMSRLIERPETISMRSGLSATRGSVAVCWRRGWLSRGPPDQFAQMARHHPLFAQYAARPNKQDGAERHADHDDLQSRRARLLAWREQRRDGAGGCRPDAPDQSRAENGAAIVAGTADDQHGPDLESQHRLVIVGSDETDEMRLHRASQPHDAAAYGEGLQAELRCVLAERARRSLVLANRAQHPAPRAAH